MASGTIFVNAGSCSRSGLPRQHNVSFAARTGIRTSTRHLHDFASVLFWDEAAGLSNDELRAAKHAVEAEDLTLATRFQQKVDARDRLQSAIDSQDEETLRMAISAGRAAGLSEEELASAIRALEASQERACNLQELRDAMASRDGDRMRSSIDKAKRLGLPDDIVWDACQELERLDQAEAARKDVVEAMRSRDIERLRETISAASAAGVDQEVLTTARKLLDELEVQAAAHQSLADAMRAGDAHKLRSAICAAEAAGLLDEELHDAREALANCVLSDAANLRGRREQAFGPGCPAEGT